jgi:excisionase family DNA binding protein
MTSLGALSARDPHNKESAVLDPELMWRSPMRIDMNRVHCGREARHADRSDRRTLPLLLTVDEAADLLRTTRRAIYAMIERRQLPGVIRIRRRVLLRADDLLHWLDQKRASSPKE